jgi:hypothetical protein
MAVARNTYGVYRYHALLVVDCMQHPYICTSMEFLYSELRTEYVCPM